MPRFETFPKVRVIDAVGSEAQVVAELPAPGIAIIPFLDLAEGGAYRLGGGFSLTHVASGRTFVPGQACIECAREVARRLAATGVDWDRVDLSNADALKASVGDQYETVIAALRLFLQCGQQMCSHDGPCGACGGEQQHAQYCIYVVGPMVARANAAAGV